MESIFIIPFALFGLMVGSFLNVVIFRLSSGETFVKGRSHCLSCNKKLTFFELIPLFSFIAQKGKCTSCNSKISFQYPLVELFTALSFAFISLYVFSQFNPFGELFSYILYSIFYILILSLLIIIFVYDLRHMLIPDVVLFPAILLVFVFRVLGWWRLGALNVFGSNPFSFEVINSITTSLIFAVLSAGFFFAIFYLSKGRAMGFGDVKLAFFMGLLLGHPGTFIALFIAFFLGGIIGVILILFGSKTLKSKVPFAPFMIAGTVISLFWGLDILNFYINFLNSFAL